MDYIRINFGLYGGLSGFGCCSPDPPGNSHPCDEGVSLGFKNEPVSIKNLIKHFSNGALSGPTTQSSISTNSIAYFLTHDQLLLAQWEWSGTTEAHVVVICGIEDGNTIWYMDPDGGKKLSLPYTQFVSHGNREWKGTLICCPSSREHPCHCYNNQYDPDLGELGIDCGGECPNCSSPPLNHCYNQIRDADEEGIDCGGADCSPCTLCNNCILDEGEDAMDCGGTCPPCEYIGNVTDEEIITNTNQLCIEMMAFNKITACCETTVASEREVNFITKRTGSIVLLPGFTAESGSTFRTQMKDLSKYERLCGAICHDYTLPTALTAPPDKLKIYNLLYALEIRYTIYNSSDGSYVYSNYFSIDRDGDFYLWDCLAGVYDGYNVPTGRKDFKMKYSIAYCKGAANLSSKEHNFYVDYCYEKSSTEGSEEPEPPPHFSPPNPDNTQLPSATVLPNFVIIPNPNSGTFQLETNFLLSDIANLKITNLLGATVYKTQNVTDHTIQLQNSASGMFFVVMLLKDGNLLTQKMMIQ